MHTLEYAYELALYVYINNNPYSINIMHTTLVEY